jgi:hypothetical protein
MIEVDQFHHLGTQQTQRNSKIKDAIPCKESGPDQVPLVTFSKLAFGCQTKKNRGRKAKGCGEWRSGQSHSEGRLGGAFQNID